MYTHNNIHTKERKVNMQTDILAIINQKGGVGKSTTAQAIGSGLFLKGYKVLFIDLDAQGNITYSLGAKKSHNTILQVLTNDAKAVDCIQHTEQGDIIQSSPILSGADTIIIKTGKEYRLKEALEPIKSNYDFIIIDTPPALSILTVNALTACNGVIIPAQADIFSLQGIGQLYDTIKTVKQYCNPELSIKGILLTRYNSRTILSREVAEQIKLTAKELHTKLYRTKIRECTALKEAQASKQSIYTYAGKSNASLDYQELLKEILKER